jgi:hypothetical protein
MIWKESEKDRKANVAIKSAWTQNALRQQLFQNRAPYTHVTGKGKGKRIPVL